MEADDSLSGAGRVQTKAGPNLRRLHGIISRYLEEIAAELPDSYRLTLVARYDGTEFADADLCVGDDGIEAAMAALARLKDREPVC